MVVVFMMALGCAIVQAMPPVETSEGKKKYNNHMKLLFALSLSA